MHVVFEQRENGPERLVCNAEIHFGPESGALSGLRLVGFSLWRSPEEEVYVTFPARASGAGSDRRYFDFIRAVEGAGEVRRLKDWILEEYRASRAAA
jgi:hypothetical protein